MKKREILILVIVGLILLWYVFFGSRIECNYTMWCKVYSVNGTEIQFIDDTGNIWAIKDDVNTYYEDERVKVYFFDNHTPDRKDDIITKVKKYTVSRHSTPQMCNEENT